MGPVYQFKVKPGHKEKNSAAVAASHSANRVADFGSQPGLESIPNLGSGPTQQLLRIFD